MIFLHFLQSVKNLFLPVTNYKILCFLCIWVQVHKVGSYSLEIVLHQQDLRVPYLCWSSSKTGLFITKSLGKMWMNTRRTQGAMVCVWGVRKWTFRTTTVTQILKWKKLEINFPIFEFTSCSIVFFSISQNHVSLQFYVVNTR